MSDRDEYRRRGHEGGVVEPIEKVGGDIGCENMYMFLVFEVCPNNVGLGEIRSRIHANQGSTSLYKTYPICRPVRFSFILRGGKPLPLRDSDQHRDDTRVMHRLCRGDSFPPEQL